MSSGGGRPFGDGPASVLFVFDDAARQFVLLLRRHEVAAVGGDLSILGNWGAVQLAWLVPCLAPCAPIRGPCWRCASRCLWPLRYFFGGRSDISEIKQELL